MKRLINSLIMFSLFLLVGCERVTGSTTDIQGFWEYNSLGQSTDIDYMFISSNQTGRYFYYQGDDSLQSENCFEWKDVQVSEVEGPETENEYAVSSTIYTVVKEGRSLIFTTSTSFNGPGRSDFRLEPVEGVSSKLEYIERGKKYLVFNLYKGLPTVIFYDNRHLVGNSILVLDENGLFSEDRQICQWHSANGTSKERPDDSVLTSMYSRSENSDRNPCLETGPIRSNYHHYVGPAYLMIEIEERISEDLFVAKDDGLSLYFIVKSSTENVREIIADDNWSEE